MSPEAMNRFFKPLDSLKSDKANLIELNDLACESRRDFVPRYSRAKNVNNQWVYLAQIGNKEIQEIEVTICTNPEQTCINDLDSPRGPKTTLCKQIYSTQKLLALDELGNVNVDTFELPSACVCKTVIKEFFNPRLSFRSGQPLIEALSANKDICNPQNASMPIDHERYTITYSARDYFF